MEANAADMHSLTPQSTGSLDPLVDRLQPGQQGVVVVGANFILADKIPVQIVQLSVASLHRCPGEDSERKSANPVQT